MVETMDGRLKLTSEQYALASTASSAKAKADIFLPFDVMPNIAPDDDKGVHDNYFVPSLRPESINNALTPGFSVEVLPTTMVLNAAKPSAVSPIPDMALAAYQVHSQTPVASQWRVAQQNLASASLATPMVSIATVPMSAATTIMPAMSVAPSALLSTGPSLQMVSAPQLHQAPVASIVPTSPHDILEILSLDKVALATSTQSINQRVAQVSTAISVAPQVSQQQQQQQSTGTAKIIFPASQSAPPSAMLQHSGEGSTAASFQVPPGSSESIHSSNVHMDTKSVAPLAKPLTQAAVMSAELTKNQSLVSPTVFISSKNNSPNMFAPPPSSSAYKAISKSVHRTEEPKTALATPRNSSAAMSSLVSEKAHSATTDSSISIANKHDNSRTSMGPAQFKLSEGFIVLISLGAMLICALMFYLFMRRRKKSRMIILQNSRSIHSSGSSLPSMLPGGEPKYHVGSGDSPRIRNITDSGASMNTQHKKLTYTEELRQGAGANTITVNSAMVRRQHQHPALFEGVLPNMRDQDNGSTEVLSRRYLNYRNQGANGAVNGSINGRQSFNEARLSAADALSKASVGINDSTQQVNSNGERLAYNRRIAGTISYDAASPNHMRRPSSMLQNEVDLYGNRGVHHRQALANNAFENPDNISGDADSVEIPSDGKLDFSSQRSLLDTSSANPNMTPGLGKKGLLITGSKPRKLVREAVKKSSPVIPDKTTCDKSFDAKLYPSPNKGVAMGRAENGNTGTAQGKANGSAFLKTMLKSMNGSPKEKTTVMQVDEQTARTEAVSTRPHGSKQIKVQTSQISHPIPDVEDNSNSNEHSKASPLLDSIESISESYQFAIRHKPPLGPLRAVEPHTPGLPDELVVERGHSLFVVGEFADGWVLAINISRESECGMIPRRCLFFPTASFMTKEAIDASNTPRPLKSE
ncbi:hypothetical protein GGI07_002066 [Coemansia sp. Benny D115]|nr:hypothetical protein GGI07_002066 [Coemansia sp. Benny D115]